MLTDQFKVQYSFQATVADIYEVYTTLHPFLYQWKQPIATVSAVHGAKPDTVLGLRG